jgi:hypothetical protein
MKRVQIKGTGNRTCRRQTLNEKGTEAQALPDLNVPNPQMMGRKGAKGLARLWRYCGENQQCAQ